MQNLGNIIKSNNQIINDQIILSCSCRRKEECTTEEKCRANDVAYKFVASATGFPSKFCLGTAQGEFKDGFTIIKCLSKKNQKRTTPA